MTTSAGEMRSPLKIQLQPRRITPEILETVEGALFLVEDVHHHVGVIRHDPLAHRKAIRGHGQHAVILLELVVDLAGDRFQMRFGRAGADDEEVGEGGNRPEVDRDDVFRFLVRGNRGAETGELFSFDGVGPGRGDVDR
jgi:hypothetical protein